MCLILFLAQTRHHHAVAAEHEIEGHHKQSKPHKPAALGRQRRTCRECDADEITRGAPHEVALPYQKYWLASRERNGGGDEDGVDEEIKRPDDGGCAGKGGQTRKVGADQQRERQAGDGDRQGERRDAENDAVQRITPARAKRALRPRAHRRDDGSRGRSEREQRPEIHDVRE